MRTMNKRHIEIGLAVLVSGMLGVGQVSGEIVPGTGVIQEREMVAQSVPPRRPGASRPGVAPPKVKIIPFFRLLGGDPTKASIVLRNFKGPDEPTILFGDALTANFTLPRHSADATSGQKIYVHVNGLSDPPRFATEGSEFRMHFAFPSLQLNGYYKNYSPEGDNEIPDVQIQNAAIDIFLQPAIGPQWRPTFAQARVVFSGQLAPPEQCLTLVDVLYPVNVCNVMSEYYGRIKTLVEHGLREAIQAREIRYQFDLGAWAQVEREIGGSGQARVVSAVFRGTDFMIQFYP